MATRGYTYVCLMATKYILFLIAKVLKRFYTIIHIGLLLSALAGFSLVGGLLFQLVESPPEQRTIALIMASRERTLQAMYETFTGVKINKRQEFQVLLGQYEINFIQAIKNGTFFSKGEALPLWTFTGSTYFCVTTFTQLGFGNLAPKSTLGRVITMIYACFSIPVGGVVFADLGRRINILITIAWSFLYNTVRRCREEANKNVDDFAPKTKNHKGNENTNNPETPGSSLNQLSSIAMISSGISIPLSEIRSPTKFKPNTRQVNTVNILRTALRYNLVMSFPRIIFGFLILEVTRTIYSYLRRRCQSHSEVCKSKREAMYRDHLSIESPDQNNVNNNAPTPRSSVETDIQGTADVPRKKLVPKLSQLFGRKPSKIKSTTPQSSTIVHQGTSETEVEGDPGLDDNESLINEINQERASAAMLSSRTARERQSYYNAEDDDEDIDDGMDRFEHSAKCFKGREESSRYDSVGIIVITAVILVIYTVVGAYILTLFEAWDFFKGIWFLFMSIITVGYGDVTPSSTVFLTYFIPFIIVGMSIFGDFMNHAMEFFNNLTGKFKVIGKSYFDVYSAKAQMSNIEKKSKRARRWWRILRQHISQGLPRGLVEESRQYKLALFGREREFIKDAFRIYFKKTYEDRLRQQRGKHPQFPPVALPTEKKTVQKAASLSAVGPLTQEEGGPGPTKLSQWARAKRRVSTGYAKFRVYVSPSPGSRDL